MNCEICGKELSRNQERFCSILCRNRGNGFKKGNPGVWLGRKMPFSDETRKMLAEKVKNYIANETVEQRQQRLNKARISRNKSKSNWIKNMKRGEEHPGWGGDNIDYFIMHKWINRYWKRKGVCETCGKETKTQWANLNHLYKRSVREDWKELCVSCHRKWDLEHNSKQG